MSSDREVMNEQSSSVREGTGYDEVYPFRCEPKEDVSCSPKREPSAHSLAEEKDEEYEEDEGEVEGDEDEEGKEEEEEEGEENDEKVDRGEGDEEVVYQVDSNGPRPFILPFIWTMNDFYLTMSHNVLKKLCDHFQIPNNIHICLSRKFKKCYLGKTVDVSMYDAMFAIGLRLPLTELHC